MCQQHRSQNHPNQSGVAAKQDDVRASTAKPYNGWTESSRPSNPFEARTP